MGEWADLDTRGGQRGDHLGLGADGLGDRVQAAVHGVDAQALDAGEEGEHLRPAAPVAVAHPLGVQAQGAAFQIVRQRPLWDESDRLAEIVPGSCDSRRQPLRECEVADRQGGGEGLRQGAEQHYPSVGWIVQGGQRGQRLRGVAKLGVVVVLDHHDLVPARPLQQRLAAVDRQRAAQRVLVAGSDDEQVRGVGAGGQIGHPQAVLVHRQRDDLGAEPGRHPA